EKARANYSKYNEEADFLFKSYLTGYNLALKLHLTKNAAQTALSANKDAEIYENISKAVISFYGFPDSAGDFFFFYIHNGSDVAFELGKLQYSNEDIENFLNFLYERKWIKSDFAPLSLFFIPVASIANIGRLFSGRKKKDAAQKRGVPKDGNLENAGLYFIQSDGVLSKGKFANIGWRVDGKDVWIEKKSKNGAAVFYSQAQSEKVMEAFLELIRQDGKIKGAKRTIARVKQITGINFQSELIKENPPQSISANIKFMPLSAIDGKKATIDNTKPFNSRVVSAILASA
ncbi:MAG: hypothetical protein LBO62_08145, partial [Endomicrobium sp.]|nr:hypothetical protein [Endomicrobium sp.]